MINYFDINKTKDGAYLVSDHSRRIRRRPGGTEVRLPILLSRVSLVVDCAYSSGVNEKLERYGSVAVGLLNGLGDVYTPTKHGAGMIREVKPVVQDGFCMLPSRSAVVHHKHLEN